MSQLVERMQHFVFPLSAANLNPVEGIALKVDLDAPFLLRGIVVWNLNVAGGKGIDGQLAIRFARPDGRLIQRQLTSSNLLAPGNQYNTSGLSPNKALAAPIRPGVLYPAGSVIQMDVMGLNTGIASPAGVIVVFVGTNLYRQGTIWAPGYPAKWKALPYLDQLTVLSLMPPGSFPSLNNAFTAQADSDFVWQAGAYSDIEFTAGVPNIGELADLGVIVRDPSYKAYSNGYVPAALLFNFLGAENPGWLYPEIYIPRLAQIYFDLNILNANQPNLGTFIQRDIFDEPPPPPVGSITVTLGLKGMKVYAQ